MFRTLQGLGKSVLASAFAAALLFPTHGALAAASFEQLYSFPTGGANGANPWSGLIMDGQGNLYGTTYKGGTGCEDSGCGTVFKLAPPYGPDSETILYSFTGGSDGASPLAGVIMDNQGNLYGATYQKGGTGCSGFGCGTIFKIAPPYGQENFSVLYTFNGGDGSNPENSLIMDNQGNLYGVGLGGAFKSGVVFKLAPPYGQGNETVLYSFKGGTDGGHPSGTPLLDNAGNLFLPTAGGGSHGYGGVYKISPPYGQNSETELYSFSSTADGINPHGALIMDQNGNIFGTAAQGGKLGQGTIFKLAPPYGQGSETVLHSFLRPLVSNPRAPIDGLTPASGVIVDAKGNLYGTTEFGGALGQGTVFKLAPPYVQGNETQLHVFNRTDGEQPAAGLVMDKAGNLYGTATYGGGTSCTNGLACGVVFEIKQ